ncbi:MAG TPA: choice-of-anchor J domain-containing protein, partial [Candidatus Cloacimonadota bacterium]|nr:choice-of-anchor J domain-containing protein [Candidatus Cloacimonadota bacterium]
PNAGGALEALITWICPSTQVNGDPLTDLDEMQVLRDDVLIYTDTNPTIGGTGIYTDMGITTAGTYTYTVVGVNDAGTGIPVSVTAIIGSTNLDPPTNLNVTSDPNDDFATFTWSAPGGGGAGFTDDFESYTDFSLTFDPWTLVDVDQSATYGFTNVDFENEYSAMAYIIFNPTATTPAMTDMVAHSGDKLAACFAATTPTNDDWMITPQVTINNGDEVSFWAKSYTDDYGLERFKVGVSTTGTAPSDFTIISTAPYEQAPADNWTEFSYDLSSYAGQDVYIGIECVSNDAFVFMVDDVTVGAPSDAVVAYNTNTAVVGNVGREIGVCETKPAVNPVNNTESRDLNGYNVYLDGELQSYTTDLTWSFYGLETGTDYTAGVQAVYDEGTSGIVTFPFTYLGGASLATPTNLNVVSNPADDFATFSWDAPAQVINWIDD